MKFYNTIKQKKIKMKNYYISKHFYLTKKFQGFVLSFDFDNPQQSWKTLLFSFEFKFLFFGCWINIYEN